MIGTRDSHRLSRAAPGKWIFCKSNYIERDPSPIEGTVLRDICFGIRLLACIPSKFCLFSSKSFRWWIGVAKWLDTSVPSHMHKNFHVKVPLDRQQFQPPDAKAA
jgi:hypothetical protein